VLPAGRVRSRALAILAFALPALLAGARFASLLAHPSLARVAAVVAFGAALAAGLSATEELTSRAAIPLRATLIVLALYLALRAAGLGAGEIAPWRWGALGHELSSGINALNGLWPYEGPSQQAAHAIMACVACGVVGSAALLFWPGGARIGGRRLLGLGLLLALYVAAATNQSRAEWPLQGLFLLAALYVWVFSTRSHRADDIRAVVWLLAGGTVAILGAVAASGGAPLVDVGAWNPFGSPPRPTSFDWDQSYGPLTWSQSGETMVRVASAHPELWRATELDRFDGVRFLRSASPPAEFPGLAGEEQSKRWITTTTFTVRGLRSLELLSPGQVLAVGIQGPTPLPRLLAIGRDGTQAFSEPPQAGVSYTVTSYAPHPTPAEMRLSPAAADGPALTAHVQLGLPGSSTPVSAQTAAGIARIAASPYAGVYELARQIAAGAPDDYDVVARTEKFLQHGFLYDTDPPTAGRYPLVSFLLRERIGYCQQFSGAMALMLRMDGIPARIAAGFLPGTRDSGSGERQVSAREAHSWVEVFFPGIGWVAFDPTPKQHTAPAPILPAGAHLSAGQLAAHARRAPSSGAPVPVRAAAAARRAGREGSTALWLLLALAFLLVALPAAAWRAASARRRAVGSGEGDPGVAEMLRALAAAGVLVPAGGTLSELERDLAGSHGREAAAYVARLRAALYGPAGTAQGPSARERRLLRRELSAGRGPATRLNVLAALPPWGAAGRGGARPWAGRAAAQPVSSNTGSRRPGGAPPAAIL
jgi:hypothetical protein